MKNILMLVTVLFTQMFLTSESVQGVEIKSIESGKCNLSPAENDNGGGVR